jgi:hypothetical protein
MKCHRTIGPSQIVLIPDSEYFGGVRPDEWAPEPRDCIGSECSAHGPDTERPGNVFCSFANNDVSWPDPAKKDGAA